MYVVVFVAVLACVLALAFAESRGRVEKVMMPMRDGVKLHTVIAYPRNFKDTEKYTIVMDRSPYGSTGLELINDIFLPFGFITVGQDMRGTSQSEGNFTIWHSDADDSFDAGNWLTAQPYSNGKIFTFGASADGLAAFRTPENQPSWLKASYFIWSSSIAYDLIFPRGAYLSALADMWIRSTVPDQADECLYTIAENEAKTSWWDPLELTGKYYKVDAPSAFWAGWYDIFLLGNLAAYDGYNTQSNTDVRYTSQILIDPLGHCQGAAGYFKEDLIAGRTLLGLGQLMQTFGIHPMYRQNIKNVTFYVMSSNDDAGVKAGGYWTSLERFPAHTQTPLYLQPDRTLSFNAPSAEAAFTYKHDPNNPVQSIGGNNLQLPCGPLDQTPVESRSDVITFTTAPFTDELPLTGPMTATIYVSSDAVDTDFIVRLSDVYPSDANQGAGEVRLIQDGGIRMRWREAGLTPVYMTAGTVYEVTLSLWNTSYVVAPGHALRVSVSSSSSPRWDVNRNNGILLKDRAVTDVNITATNTIYTSAAYPSRVYLPVVKKRDLPEVHDLKAEVMKAYPSIDWETVIKEYPDRLQKMAFPF